MYKCQQSLIEHLKPNFEALTVEEYAGQLGSEAATQNITLPAILIAYIDGTPLSTEPEHNFDLIYITESDTLDRKESRNLNLQGISSVADFIIENDTFRPYDGSSGSYAIQKEADIPCRVLRQTHKHTIISLGLKIKDHTRL